MVGYVFVLFFSVIHEQNKLSTSNEWKLICAHFAAEVQEHPNTVTSTAGHPVSSILPVLVCVCVLVFVCCCNYNGSEENQPSRVVKLQHTHTHYLYRGMLDIRRRNRVAVRATPGFLYFTLSGRGQVSVSL